jgi:cell wall-associated NlpC family hydrolase
MKTAMLTTIFLSSITFFSGCAENNPSADNKLSKESLSVYNIMGIKEPNKNEPIFVVEDDNRPKYHFITNNTVPNDSITYQEESSQISNNITNNISDEISNNIEVVSYGSYTPTIYPETIDLINNIELNAKSFLGTKYVWGATGPTKFDCSGFTQWIYRDAGINIPRVSRDQARVGDYVSYQNLRRGDMVFFDTKKHKKGIVTHVGIYLGDGNFIHASSAAKKVVVYNFDEKPFYKERFLWGRRVVQDNRYYAANY